MVQKQPTEAGSPYGRPARVGGFTLLELLVTVAIIGVLIALLSTGVSNIKAKAGQAACASNLRQIGRAFISYAAENEGKLPPHWGTGFEMGLSWYGFIAPYVAEWDTRAETTMSKVFYCPSNSRPFNATQTYISLASNGDQSYGYNYEFLSSNPLWTYKSLRKLSIQQQTKLVIVADIPALGNVKDCVSFPSNPSWLSLYPSGGFRGVSPRHAGSANFLFLDGHVEPRNASDFLGPEFDLENWVPTAN